MTKETLRRRIKGDAKNRKGHKLIGISLTLIGFFWFAKKVGWISVATGGSAIFWPAALFLFGVFILVGAGHRRKKHVE